MSERAMPTPTTLVRVVAPHFVAGLDMVGDKCVEAAPILKWAKGKTADELRAYFKQKGWRASIIDLNHVSQI